jgi:hypothetical protein
LGVGIGIGLALGVAIGVAMDNIPVGIGAGLALGAGIGASLDARSEGAEPSGSTRIVGYIGGVVLVLLMTWLIARFFFR